MLINEDPKTNGDSNVQPTQQPEPQPESPQYFPELTEDQDPNWIQRSENHESDYLEK